MGGNSLLRELGLFHLRHFPTLRDHRIHLVMLGKPLSGALHQPQRMELGDDVRDLCKSPDVDDAMHRWWDWVPRRKHWMLEHDEFRMLNRLCFEELAPTLPHYGDMYDEIAEAAGALDWDYISKGEKALSYPEFVHAMLELADNFHHSSEGSEYAAWLHEMYDRVRRRYEEDAAKYGRIYIWGGTDGESGQPSQLSQKTKSGATDSKPGAHVSIPNHSEAPAPKKHPHKHQHVHKAQRQRPLKAWSGKKYEVWEEGRDNETLRANAGVKSRMLQTDHGAIPSSPIEGWPDPGSPSSAPLKGVDATNSMDVVCVHEDGFDNGNGLELVEELRLRTEAGAIWQVGGGGFVSNDAKSRGIQGQQRAPALARGLTAAGARPHSALSAASTVARSRPQSAMELHGIRGIKLNGDDDGRAKVQQRPRPRTALGHPQSRHNVRTSQSIYSCKNNLPLRKMDRSASASSSSSDIHYGVSTVQFLTNDGVFAEHLESFSPTGSLRSAIRPLSANFSVRVQRTTRVKRSDPHRPSSLAARSFSPRCVRAGFASPLSGSLQSSKDCITEPFWPLETRHASDAWDLPVSRNLLDDAHAVNKHAQLLLQDRQSPTGNPPSPTLQWSGQSSRLVGVDDLCPASLHEIHVLHGAGCQMPLPQEPSKDDLRPLDDGVGARQQLGELLLVRRVYGKHTCAHSSDHLRPADTSLVLDLDLLGNASCDPMLWQPLCPADPDGNQE